MPPLSNSAGGKARVIGSDQPISVIGVARLRDHFRWRKRAHDVSGSGRGFYEILGVGPTQPLVDPGGPLCRTSVFGEHVRESSGGGDGIWDLRVFVVSAAEK